MKIVDVSRPIARPLNVLLADDDNADCILFKAALDELPVTIKLTTVHDGDQLLDLLHENQNDRPDVLFLDLNMPRKNGYVALGLIKRDNELLQLPVVIFSTVSEEDKVSRVFRDAAHYYIRKPSEFAELKRVIYEALSLIAQKNIEVPEIENFVLTGALKSIPNEIEAPSEDSPGKTG
jgi:CheY-like chemotaxis protein